jgi:hypothetical protein
MAQHRFNFEITATDFSLRREAVNIIAARDNHVSQLTINAIPTHDGYFSLVIPIGHGDYQVGIQFGAHYQWVQIDSAEIIQANELYTSKESQHTMDASANLGLDNLQFHGDGLYQSTSDAGLLVYIPSTKLGDHHYVLRIIFRPITARAG